MIREMKEETGLTILNPRLVGVKQFPLENGRYVVLLFKATQWSGDLISSEEGQMEWIKYSDLSVVKTVDVNKSKFAGVIDENCRSYRKQKTIS